MKNKLKIDQSHPENNSRQPPEVPGHRGFISPLHFSLHCSSETHESIYSNIRVLLRLGGVIVNYRYSAVTGVYIG